MTPVTRPYLPEPERFRKRLERVWSSHRLTNGGPLLDELTERLSEYLGVKYLLLVSSGTVGLKVALKALGVRGEVVTTPFTFSATSAAIRDAGCQPIYSGIESETWNLSPAHVGIYGRSGIMPVHLYGAPCDVEAFDNLGRVSGVPVVYDACQAFGTKVGNRSVMQFGNASVLSLHATKIMHTVEGGAIAFRDEGAYRVAKGLINFQPEGYGINGKLSEFHAAMGLCVFEDMPSIMVNRWGIKSYYLNRLEGLVGFQSPDSPPSYMPVLFGSNAGRETARKNLLVAGIESRPGFNVLGWGQPAKEIAYRVLCLPMYSGLKPAEVERVCDVIERATLPLAA